MMKNVQWKKIFITVLISCFLGVQYEYLGWRIAEIHLGGMQFPGLMDASVILGGLKTALAALFFGGLILVLSLLSPKFRQKFPKNAHKPVIIGVVVIYLLIGITIFQGFYG